MPKQIGWSTEAYLLSQIKSLLAKVGSMSSGGITSLNGLTDASQTFAVGTAGAGFSISSAGGVHTFNIPNASASAKGLLTAVDWSTFNNKQNALTNPVTGTGVSGQVAYWNGTTTQTGSNNLFWDAANGRLGVGTTSPSGLFHARISANAQLIFQNSSQNNLYLSGDNATLNIDATNGTLFPGIFIRLGGTAYGQLASSTSGTQLISFQNTPTTFVNGSVERMRITSGGNVGIGTTSPAGKLTVDTAQAGGALALVLRTNDGVSPNSAIRWQNNANAYTVGIGSRFNAGDDGLEFLTQTNQTRMSIRANGNVLVGTTTDSGYRLDVSGTFRTTGNAIIQDAARIVANSPFAGVNYTQVDGQSYDINIGSRTSNIIRFFTSDIERVRITSNANVGISQSTFGTSATNTLAIASGTAPTTSPADAFQMYSADVVAGNAAPHIRTENGAVVKVYQETTGVAAATLVSNAGTAITSTDTFDGYTLQQIVKALRNQGLLA